MKIRCLLGHKWDGCTCARCGQRRDEEHSWNGCRCTLCGRTRNEQHSWDDCKCTYCGKLHDFDNNRVCRICGARLVDETELVESHQPCTGCSNGSGYGCTGDTATCINSEDYRIMEEVTQTYIVNPDGTKWLY